MAFLGPGGGNKTVCRAMGPEMKKKYIIGDTFLKGYLPDLLENI